MKLSEINDMMLVIMLSRMLVIMLSRMLVLMLCFFSYPHTHPLDGVSIMDGILLFLMNHWSRSWARFLSATTGLVT